MSRQLLLPWPEDTPRADAAEFVRHRQRRVQAFQQPGIQPATSASDRPSVVRPANLLRACDELTVALRDYIENKIEA